MKNNTTYCILFCITTLINVSCKTEQKNVNIQSIYNQFISVNNNPSYKNRYVPLPMERNNKNWRWEGKDFPRVMAILEFERFINKNHITADKALIVDPSPEGDPEEAYLACKNKRIIRYEDDPINNDLHRLNLPETGFDFVMLNQVLEHVYDPIRCLQNIYTYMRPGGILYANVPANNIPHSTPFHYYTGYTPTGLGAVVQAAGFKILSIGQWGNTAYIDLLFIKNKNKWPRWPDYREVAHIEPNPGINDFDCPVITWIFAQKE